LAFVVLYRLFALSFYFPVFIEFLRFFSLKKKVCINYKRQKVSTVTNNDKKFTTVFCRVSIGGEGFEPSKTLGRKLSSKLILLTVK